ncbi:chemotaxis protein [Stappia sp. F7233]|uniref:Chemotaxis protein n=1 Tax=Stappia albiluteola TaxID=2758565 RepID=A0A839AJU3_9HYPH|nr:DUF6468 domain-containing protein [Stappia albiluteola]MBA5779298.1 chemotaxis protein [Stappia albiluteola]
MSNLPVGMIIESLVAALLLVTICYCWVLNHRLKRLRADEESLRATISELITASEIAERAILGLKATAGEADKTLGQRLLEAERLSRSLSEQITVGGVVLDRISQIAEAAKTASAQRATAVAPETAAEQKPAVAQSVSARDLRTAAAEAAARLERFRKRGEERAA